MSGESPQQSPSPSPSPSPRSASASSRAPAPSPGPDHAGASANAQRFGTFRTLEKLGAGAMGVVYKVVHEPTNRLAAVKTIVGDTAKGGNMTKRFRREAKILKEFRHPNIVRFYAEGINGNDFYMAMELIDGVTLDQVLRERGQLDWREAAALGIQLCSALQYAHERNVVHRDLKPSNIMVTRDRVVKLTDFGIAKETEGSILTATGKTVGTAHFMAPEQIMDSKLVTHKTDLYALGVLLFQLLSGSYPFHDPVFVNLLHKHLYEPPPPISALISLPSGFNDLILELMAKEPNLRPESAAAVGQRLTRMLDEERRRVPASPSISSAPPSPRAPGGLANANAVTVESEAPESLLAEVQGRSRTKSSVKPFEKPGCLGVLVAFVSAAFSLWRSLTD